MAPLLGDLSTSPLWRIATPGAGAIHSINGGSIAPGRAGQAAHLQLHQPLGGKADHLAQQIGIGGLLDQAAQRHHLVGHRGISGSGWRLQPDPTEEPAMTTAPPPARQRFNPRGRAAALPIEKRRSYTTMEDQAWVSTRLWTSRRN
jgi:hypothetical protein